MSEPSAPARQPMLYNSVVPINREVHGDVGVDAGVERFAFARRTHLVPALLDEFVIGGRALPIFFSPGIEAPAAVFLTGFSTGQNVMVAEGGRWLGAYVPAYLRRYPFIIGEAGPDQAFLCIDESWSGCRPSDGERLFAAGEETPFLRAQLDFSTEYLAAARRTEAFVALLLSLKLLKSVDVSLGRTGVKHSIHGLLVVDEERLAELSSEEFASLRPYLPAVYAQLHSLQAIRTLEANLDAEPANAA